MKIHTLGLIAGGGMLPAQILAACESQSIEVFIIGFEGHTHPDFVKGRNHLWTRLGAVGLMIKTLKERGITDIVMAGSIKRPSFSDLRPDLKGAQILSRIGLKALGDNALLTALRQELEAEGFTLHGVQKFSDRLIAPHGCIGSYAPLPEDDVDIQFGFKASQALGALDIGQSVVVQGCVVLGVEAVEGTDVLIKRCGVLKKTGRGPILVKTCKPQQDRDLDLPTIGPDTVMAAHEHGFVGIVVQAGNSIILDIKAVADLADQYKMFVVGV